MTKHVPYGSYKDSVPKIVTIREDEACRADAIIPCKLVENVSRTTYLTLRRKIYQKTFGKIPIHFNVHHAFDARAQCIEPSHLYLEGYYELEKV